jgi:2-oxoglutarate dehydrogenase E1 component
MGAWSHIEPRLAAAMEAAGTKQARPHYAGRPANPSPAPALGEAYAVEQRAVVEQALS